MHKTSVSILKGCMFRRVNRRREERGRADEHSCGKNLWRQSTRKHPHLFLTKHSQGISIQDLCITLLRTFVISFCLYLAAHPIYFWLSWRILQTVIKNRFSLLPSLFLSAVALCCFSVVCFLICRVSTRPGLLPFSCFSVSLRRESGVVIFAALLHRNCWDLFFSYSLTNAHNGK